EKGQEEAVTHEPVEAKGGTVEEAIDAALAMLGATEDEVEIRVLSEGFGEPARVFAKMRDERSAEDLALVAEAEGEHAAAEDSYSDEEMDEQADAAVGCRRRLLDRMAIVGDIEAS